MFGLNETRYGTKDLIGWDVNGGVEDITIHNLLVEVGLLEEDHEYEELTVRPDMEGKMKDVEDGLDSYEEIIEEVSKKSVPIKKAAGGLAYMLGE